MITVDIVGPNGSGKSYVVPRLVDLAREKGKQWYTVRQLASERLPVSSDLDSLLNALGWIPWFNRKRVQRRWHQFQQVRAPAATLDFLRDNPELLQKFDDWCRRANATGAVRQTRIDRCLRALGTWHAAQQLLGPDEVFLWEEDTLTHKVEWFAMRCHTRLTELDCSILSEELRVIPCADVYVSLHADPAQRWRRLQSRPTGNPDKQLAAMPSDEARLAVMEKRDHLKRTVEAELTRHGIKVVRFDNSQDTGPWPAARRLFTDIEAAISEAQAAKQAQASSIKENSARQVAVEARPR